MAHDLSEHNLVWMGLILCMSDLLLMNHQHDENLPQCHVQKENFPVMKSVNLDFLN